MPTGDEPSLSRDLTPEDDRDAPALGGDAATVHLLHALEDKDRHVRHRAMNALAERGDARAVDALIRTFFEMSWNRALSTDWIEHHLVRIGTPAVVPLIRLITDLPNRPAENAVRVLGMIAEQHENVRDEIRPHVVRALREHGYRTAPAALAQCGDALPVLADALATSSEFDLQQQIIEALNRTPAEGFPIVQHYIRSLPSGSQRQMLRLYVKFKADAVPDELAYYVQSHPNASIREQALSVLVEYHSKHQAPDVATVTEIALQALDDPSDSVHVPAILWLGELRDRAYLALLLDHTSSESRTIRLTAARSLGASGFAECVHVLINLMSDEDNEVRLAAIDAAGELKHPAAVSRICEILRSHRDMRSRGATIRALKSIGDPAAVPDLYQCVADTLERGEYVGHLLEALAAIGGPSVVEALLVWFNTPETRRMAAVPLAQTGSEEAIRAVVEWAYTPHSATDPLYHRIQALQAIHDPRAIDALRHIGTPEALAAAEHVIETVRLRGQRRTSRRA